MARKKVLHTVLVFIFVSFFVLSSPARARAGWYEFSADAFSFFKNSINAIQGKDSQDPETQRLIEKAGYSDDLKNYYDAGDKSDEIVAQDMLVRSSVLRDHESPIWKTLEGGIAWAMSAYNVVVSLASVPFEMTSAVSDKTNLIEVYNKVKDVYGAVKTIWNDNFKMDDSDQKKSQSASILGGVEKLSKKISNTQPQNPSSKSKIVISPPPVIVQSPQLSVSPAINHNLPLPEILSPVQEVAQLPSIKIIVNGNSASDNLYDVYSDAPVTFSWLVNNSETVVGIQIKCSALSYDGGSAKFIDGYLAGTLVECDNGRGASQIYQAALNGRQTVVFHNPTTLPRGVGFSVFAFSSNEDFETAKANNPSISALAISNVDLTFKRTQEEQRRLVENPVIVKVNNTLNFIEIPSQPNMVLKMEWDIDPDFLLANRCYYFLIEPYKRLYGYPGRTDGTDDGIWTSQDSFNLTFDESPETSRRLFGVYCFNKEESTNNKKILEDKLHPPSSIAESEYNLKKLGNKADWVEILIIRKVKTPEWFSKIKPEFIVNQESVKAGSRINYSLKMINISGAIAEIPEDIGISFSYFLSKDSNLDLYDIELDKSFLGLSYRPLIFEVDNSPNFNNSSFTVPSNTPSGYYFIGVLFEDGSQASAPVIIE